MKPTHTLTKELLFCCGGPLDGELYSVPDGGASFWYQPHAPEYLYHPLDMPPTVQLFYVRSFFITEATVPTWAPPFHRWIRFEAHDLSWPGVRERALFEWTTIRLYFPLLCFEGVLPNPGAVHRLLRSLGIAPMVEVRRYELVRWDPGHAIFLPDLLADPLNQIMS